MDGATIDGIGLRGNRVEHSLMDGIYVHRITHFDNQEDSLGSLLGTRTCPVGVMLSNLTLANVVVPSVSGVNQVRILVVAPATCRLLLIVGVS